MEKEACRKIKHPNSNYKNLYGANKSGCCKNYNQFNNHTNSNFNLMGTLYQRFESAHHLTVVQPRGKAKADKMCGVIVKCNLANISEIFCFKNTKENKKWETK